MKRFPRKTQKAASIEDRYEASKPLKPGPTRLSESERKNLLKFYGPVMGKDLIRIHEESLRKRTCKSLSEYRRRMVQWKGARDAEIKARDEGIKRQKEDERNRYYACSRCGTEAGYDGRDAWQVCEHNDRFIQQRDRRQSYPEPEYYR